MVRSIASAKPPVPSTAVSPEHLVAFRAEASASLAAPFENRPLPLGVKGIGQSDAGIGDWVHVLVRSLAGFSMGGF